MREVPSQVDDAVAPLAQDQIASLVRDLRAVAPALADRLGSSEQPVLDAATLASQDFIDALSRAEVGVVHRAIDGRIIAANDFFCRLVGRERSQLDAIRIEDHSHPDEVAPLLELYRQHSASGTPFRMERRYLRPDGTASWCLVHVSFLCDPDGQPTSTIAVVLDDSIRRNAEAELRESELHYRNSVELAPQIRWTAAPDGAILEVSPRWEDVTGLTCAEALGFGWIAALHPEDETGTLDCWRAALSSKQPVDVEYRLRTADGSDCWFRAQAAPRLSMSGEVIRWYGALEDIDDRKRTEQALRESEERFRLAAQAAGLGIWDFDAVNGRREWSDDFKRMLGLPLDAEPEISTAMALVVPEDRHLLANLIQAVQNNDSDHRFEVLLRIRRVDNREERWMQTSGWRIEAPNGRLDRVLVTIRDVTEQQNADERVRWIANHDSLTGLPNRGFFNARLEAAIAHARSGGTSLALVIFDIDNFKEANDTIGHDAGDRLLCDFARRLRDHLGPHGFVARLGGDEFAAFFEVSDEADVAQLVLPALSDDDAAASADDFGLSCQATAGASLLARDGVTAEDLLKTADIALYAGKAAQRGTLTLFRPEMRAHVQRRASMLAVARNVLAEDRLVPFYQPKVALADGSIVGFEALLRWRHDQHGIRGPDHLWAAFEDLNLATALGERMLDRVCRDVTRWRDAGLSFGRVAINLSPAEFRREDLFDRVMNRLQHCGLPPTLFELEVTETVFLGRGAEMVGDVLEKFHRAGLSLALDDFGTGYASLTHLQAFPVDVIKIDRSFVTNLAPESANAAIVEAIIGLAGRLGMTVIAEGVEAQAEADFLRAHGCKYGQGFLFGQAMAPEAVHRLLLDQRERLNG